MYLHQYPVVYVEYEIMGTSYPPPDRGGLDSQVATKPADRLLSVG